MEINRLRSFSKKLKEGKGYDYIIDHYYAMDKEELGLIIKKFILSTKDNSEIVNKVYDSLVKEVGEEE